MPNPGRTLFYVALLENDNAAPDQVEDLARSILPASLTAAWSNATNRKDLDHIDVSWVANDNGIAANWWHA
jgi:hypothetical protein